MKKYRYEKVLEILQKDGEIELEYIRKNIAPKNAPSCIRYLRTLGHTIHTKTYNGEITYVYVEAPKNKKEEAETLAKKALVLLMQKHFSDDKGNICIPNLDFSGCGNVDLSYMTVDGDLTISCANVSGAIYQSRHRAGKVISQGEHKTPDEIRQSRHQAALILQDTHRVTTDLHQEHQSVKGRIYQDDKKTN